MRHAHAWLLVLVLVTLAAASSGEDLTIAGQTVLPGEKRQIGLETSESFAGVRVQTPVVVVRGIRPGPVLCLTAGVHGDELIGVEAVRRIAEALTPAELRGTVIAVPIANPQGFRRSSRYLPDRRDLNRFFPGREGGSAASRIAFQLFDGIVRKCSHLVDFHTGSFHRTNVPHVRADLTNELAAELARWFYTPIVIQSTGTAGTLRRAALDAGVAAVTFEAGEPMRFQSEGIDAGVAATTRLLVGLKMIEGPAEDAPAPEFYYRTRWVRVDEGGILLTAVEPGARVETGETLGTVTDPISNQRQVLISPVTGRVVGMALSQVVIPGFAAFHIAIEGTRIEDAELDDQTASDAEEDQYDDAPLDDDWRPEE